MSLRINSNVEAFNAHRNLVGTSGKLAKSMERLSSGYRINKAADDVREKVALIRPLLRDEVKEPRISRFDPQSVPIFNVAVLSDDAAAVVRPGWRASG